MHQRAVVLSFDRLHLGFLGCYGNDWMETPNLDRLATEGVVFDRHFAENIDPRAASHAWWTGRFQSLVDPEAPQENVNFLPALEQQGIRTTLLLEADDSESACVAPAFEEVIEVRGIDRLGGSERETPFARLVVRAEEWLQGSASDESPRLLWLKSRGVPDPWLTPDEFGDLYLEEFGLGEDESEEDLDHTDETADTEPAGAPADERLDRMPRQVASPPRPNSPAEEAALELSYARALYAGYVSWLDRWLGKLLRSLDRAPGWEETLLIVTAAAGQSLGEHAPLADKSLRLRDELVHTLLLVRHPGRENDGTRRPALVQTVDIPATILDWFGIGLESSKLAAGEPGVSAETSALVGKSLLPIVRNEEDFVRDCALIRTPDEWGLRTDDFLYVTADENEGPLEAPPALLFEKPHDRWDHADVAAQYPAQVDELHADLVRLRNTSGMSARP